MGTRYQLADGRTIIADAAFIAARYPDATLLPFPQLAWSSPDLDPRYWQIDVGPFFDRFGAKALAVAGSTDPQVQGLMMLVTPRQYVDLQRADLAGMLDLLISKALINRADKTAILTTPTTDYERHIKGLEQPI